MPKGSLFGVESSLTESSLVLIPVPWEVTTSYGVGTSKGPLAILKASDQIDKQDPHFGDVSKKGLHWMDQHVEALTQLNETTKTLAQKIIRSFDQSGLLPPNNSPDLKAVNQASEKVTNLVYQSSRKILEAKKIPAVVGGDHSCPLGLMKALGERENNFSILHIDAHADLRKSYQGFQQSHASIMWNAINTIPQIDTLVSVAIRDYCQEEFEFAETSTKISTFYNANLKAALFQGCSWHQLCQDIVGKLGEKVYISFDIDGLSPEFCPNTGTPVPGGLSFDQASYLLHLLSQSSRQIIGFDLCEVAPGQNSELDANIGMRLLYKLCGCTLETTTKPS